MATAILRNDAKNRAIRTLYQGLFLDVLIAVGASLSAWLATDPTFEKAAWVALGVAVTKSVLQAVAAWLMRLKLDQSSFPTPLPPSDPGEPDAEIAA